MRKSRCTEEHFVGILGLALAGQKVGDVCRQHGISGGKYYRWKAKYGGLDANELRRMQQLEDENRRLEPLVAELTQDVTALKDIASPGGRNCRP